MGRQEGSFWFPLHDDKFYPDSEEKQNIGELWAEESGGEYLFLMVVKVDDKGGMVDKRISQMIG